MASPRRLPLARQSNPAPPNASQPIPAGVFTHRRIISNSAPTHRLTSVGNDLYAQHFATFADFRARIETCLSQLGTTHKAKLAKLMTLKFQTVNNRSILAVEV